LLAVTLRAVSEALCAVLLRRFQWASPRSLRITPAAYVLIAEAALPRFLGLRKGRAKRLWAIGRRPAGMAVPFLSVITLISTLVPPCGTIGPGGTSRVGLALLGGANH